MGRNKQNINIKYTCLGASKQVTGSCHKLSIYIKDNKPYNIIVDCGMVQNGLKTMNELYKDNLNLKNIDWENIQTVAITHSHADHLACLPISVMNGYTGFIYSTAPTIELSKLILTDSAFIQNKECEKYNETKKGKKSPIYPIYGQRHVELTLERFRGYDYNKPIILTDEITMWLKPTGHLLGACSVYLEVKSGNECKRVLFTGDTSANKELPFTMLPDFKDLKLDAIFTEGTYGNKTHKQVDMKEYIKNSVIETVVKNNGQLVIPVFSVGRSSLVLSYLYEIYQECEELFDIPVYLASPMACKAHNIYGADDSFNFYNESDRRLKDVFNWNKVQYIENYKEVENKLFNKDPKIVCVSSGMIEGGYSVAMVSSVLPSDKNKILFVGYQGLGSTGRNILESKYNDVIKIDSKNVKRRCDIDFVSMSSHADYKQIIDMIKTMRHSKIKNIFLNHGEEEVLVDFKKHLEKEFKCEITIADKDKSYSL